MIPGVQGRWEWMRRRSARCSRSCRAITYTLCGDVGSGTPFDPSAGVRERTSRQLDDVIDDRHHARGVCGVSFGGFIALRYAARGPNA